MNRKVLKACGPAGRLSILPAAALVLASMVSPAAACDISVASAQTVTITVGISIDCFEVKTGGTLDIRAVLQVIGPGNCTLDGEVLLPTGISSICFALSSETLSGSGEIFGQNDSASIDVGMWSTLTSQVLIRGNLNISGLGTFANEGRVLAYNSGTLEVSVAHVADSASSGAVSSANFRWGVTHSSAAMLLFSASATGLAGHFYVHAGALQVGVDPFFGDSIGVCTSGSLLFDGGMIVAGVHDSARFNSSCP